MKRDVLYTGAEEPDAGKKKEEGRTILQKYLKQENRERSIFCKNEKQ